LVQPTTNQVAVLVDGNQKSGEKNIHPFACFVNLVKIVGLTISAEVLNHETVSQGDKLVVHLGFSLLFYSQMFFPYEYKIS